MAFRLRIRGDFESEANWASEQLNHGKSLLLPPDLAALQKTDQLALLVYDY